MSDDPDRLTKAEACARLQVGERTLDQFVKDGKLDPRRWRPAGGGQWRTVFLAEDVDRLVQERQGGPPAPFLVPPTAGPSNGNGRSHTDVSPHVHTRHHTEPSGEAIVRAVFALLRQMVSGQPALEGPQEGPQAPQGPQPAYVDKTAALAIAGVSYGALRAAVQAGEVKQRGRRYRRTDLEAL